MGRAKGLFLAVSTACFCVFSLSSRSSSESNIFEKCKGVLRPVKHFLTDYDKTIFELTEELSQISKDEKLTQGRSEKLRRQKQKIEQELEWARACKFNKENRQIIRACQRCADAASCSTSTAIDQLQECEYARRVAAEETQAVLERVERNLLTHLLEIMGNDIAMGSTSDTGTIDQSSNPVNRILVDFTSAMSESKVNEPALLNKLYKSTTGYKNPYSVLGVSSNSTTMEINTTYNKLISNKRNKMAYHPDDIKTAHEILINPYRRAQTDKLLAILRHNIHENLVERHQRIKAIGPICKSA